MIWTIKLSDFLHLSHGIEEGPLIIREKYPRRQNSGSAQPLTNIDEGKGKEREKQTPYPPHRSGSVSELTNV
jgi:hypothetical protein